MKKINLIICACSFIFAALSISCKNETVERTDVNLKEYHNYYTISGTVSTVRNKKTYDAAGTLTAEDTITQAVTIESGRAEMEWTTSKTNSTNGDIIKISAIDMTGKLNVTEKDMAGNENKLLTDSSIANTQFASRSFSLIKIGKKYYAAKKYNYATDYVIISDGFECENLTSGEDFTFACTFTEKQNNNLDPVEGDPIPVDYDSKEEKITIITETYNVKFTAL